MRGMDALQRVGLVDEVGVSNYSLQRWRAAEDALGGRVLSNQVRYSLVARSPEQDLLPFAESHDRMVIAYSPLGQGLLSGRYDRNNRPANRVRARLCRSTSTSASVARGTRSSTRPARSRSELTRAPPPVPR